MTAAGISQQFHLTERIYSLGLERQLAHKIGNLLFTITNHDIKLTLL
jgi:hypothetical protein